MSEAKPSLLRMRTGVPVWRLQRFVVALNEGGISLFEPVITDKNQEN